MTPMQVLVTAATGSSAAACLRISIDLGTNRRQGKVADLRRTRTPTRWTNILQHPGDPLRVDSGAPHRRRGHKLTSPGPAR